MLPTTLSEDHAADLYIYFPTNSDVKRMRAARYGAFWVGPRESVEQYRDGVVNGTEVVAARRPPGIAIERIKAAFPKLEHLGWVARAARRAMLQATWRPVSVAHFRELAWQPATRLVRSERELADGRTRVSTEEACKQRSAG